MNPSIASPLLLVAILFFLLGLARLIRIFKSEITPFHMVFALFALECATQFVPMVETLPGEKAQHLSIETEIFMVLASASLFAATFIIRRRPEFEIDSYRVASLIPIWLVAATFGGMIAAISLVNFVRLGTFPIFTLVRGQEYLGPEESFLPFFTPLSWGLGRCLAVILALVIATNHQPWRRFVVRNAVLLACTGVAVVLNTLDGMRNTTIMPALLLYFGTTRRFRYSLKKSFVASAACLIFFCAMGSMRVGTGDWKSTLTVSSGNKVIDTLASWTLTYTEPNIENLDALINADPPLNYGLQILSTTLPGPLKNVLFEAPETSTEFMADHNLIVHSGLTFRTIYADLLKDFGYWGTLLAGALLLAGCMHIYIKSAYQPRMFVVYLTIIPGIIFFPVVNSFVTITNLLPFALLLILRFHWVGTEHEDEYLEDRKETMPAKSEAAV